MNEEKARGLCTPTEYVPAVYALFPTIDTDPCPNRFSAIRATREYYRPRRDGLLEPWVGRTYVNPPWGYDYDAAGKVIQPWLRRCGMYRHTADILALIPTAFGSAYWRELVLAPARALCHVTDSRCPLVMPDGQQLGRVAVTFAYYGPRTRTFARAFTPIGTVWVRS